MSLPKQNKYFFFVAAYILLTLTWGISSSPNNIEEPVKMLQAKASIFDGKEDLQSRWEYEQQMLADPKTGEIPFNYIQKEKAFAERLKIENLKELKVSESTDQPESTSIFDWFAVGPNNFGGRTRAFALDVTNENILLAGGVSGGMWKSTDDGANWNKSTTSAQIHSASSIAQDIRSGKENVWYYGTGELVGNSTRAPGAPFRGDGIFKSIDGGNSWTQLSATAAPSATIFSSPLQYVWDITTDPNSNDDVVIAAVWSGIVRSADGGETWTTVLGRDLLDLPDGSDLNSIESIFYTDVHRTSDNTFYASLSSNTNSDQLAQEGGYYRSTDGINWVRILPLNTRSNRRTEISSSPSSPNLVFFLTDAESGHELRRYDANTSQFVDLSENIPDGGNGIDRFDSQNSYNLMVRVHPDNPDVVFLGGTNLYRSTDGFTSTDNTTWIGGYNPSEEGGSLYPNHHPDQHELIFIPSFPNAAFSLNDGGIFLTQNILAEEVAYSSVNNDYVTTQYYTGVFSKYPPDDFVIGGTQDNGSILTQNINRPNSPNGNRVLGGDGAFAATTRFGVYYYMSFQNSRIYRLTLNSNGSITSFARVDPIGGGGNPSQPYLFINPYVLDPNNGNRMYLAGGDVVWRNRNLSQIPSGTNNPTSVNWTRMARSRIGVSAITAITTSTNPPNIVYYGTGNGVLNRIDKANGEDYEVTSLNNSTFPENGYIRSIAVDPTDAENILVSFSNYNVISLFYSENGGQSFTDVSGNLEENPDGTGAGPSVRWVTIVPKQDNSSEYFVGTSIGLFRTTALNGSATVWEAEGEEEIGNVVVNMIDYRRHDGKAVVATHGNGMYTTQIPNVLPFDIDGGEGGFAFESVFPNPFRDFTTLSFTVPDTDFTLLRVYDSSGRLVDINSGSLAFTGTNEFFWDGTNTLGQPVPNGVYIARLTYRGVNKAKKVLLSR